VVCNKLIYNNPKEYEAVKGKKTKNTPLIPIELGGRPKIKKHKPFAENQAKIMLVEPKDVVNTGE
jgi:hypothetical protein|tara:strand:+ start:449 stop:643 length:195 start_codon:yes stop_codon:yes gene_type:complete